jgi:predicted nucleotidyltransferase
MLNIIGNHNVRKILNLVIKEEQSLTDITNQLQISKPTALKYLNSMENLQLITSKYQKTRQGRVKRYEIGSYSFVFSADKERGILLFSIDDQLNIENPLVGQIPQKLFREAVNVYITEISKSIGEACAVIVYGSIARGEATAKSDIDMLLLSEKKWNKQSRSAVMKKLYKGVLKTQIQAKPLFLSIDEFKQKNKGVFGRIKTEGIIVQNSLKGDDVWKAMKRYWNIID